MLNRGQIHVFFCHRKSRPIVKPHFFLAHDWGYVMDLRWLPIPIQCTSRPGVSGEHRTSIAAAINLSAKQMNKLISGIVGHLIAACTDGFVRVFPIPACDNRMNLSKKFRLVIPATISPDGTPNNVYQFKPKTVLRLAPSTGEDLLI